MQQDLVTRCVSVNSPPASANSLYFPASPSQQEPTSCGFEPAGISEPNATPLSSDQPSPTNINIKSAFRLVVKSYSYNRMWTITHPPDQLITTQHPDNQNNVNDTHRQMLTRVLEPNPECIQDALRIAQDKSNTRLTSLVSTYFQHSQDTARLCLILQDSVRDARLLYSHLHSLLHDLPLDSLTQSQCEHAFDKFTQFNSLNNPFVCHDTQSFDEMRIRFSELKHQLDRRLRKSSSRLRLARAANMGSAYCFVGTSCTACISPKFAKKEIAHVTQLDAAGRGTYLLINYLDNLDRLVVRLNTAIEADKSSIRLGLEWGRNKHPIEEILRQLRRNHDNCVKQLEDLDQHICICFNAINTTRSALLRVISSL